jgi:carboxyl-terminal processing protease
MNRRLLVFGFLLLGAALLLVVRDSLARRSGIFEHLDLLADVRHEIVSSYVEKPDEPELIEAAVRGMIDALDDPYTAFLSPDENDAFDKHVRGSFSGIGAMVDLDPDEPRREERRLRIVSPLEESPAWNSGVMAGDVVLEIDGVDTKGMRINECVKRLTGEVGTQVTITVRHPSAETEPITITRAQINIQTVKGFRRDAEQRWRFMVDEPNRIGYVRVTQFTERTTEDLEAALDQIVAADAAGVVLDLRFNAGGLLSSAVDVSDLFLERGRKIVSMKGRTIPEKMFRSTSDPVLAAIPVVVLANEASASAAEIVTGALADNQRAKFIGMRTFGKGSVQQYKLLMDHKHEMQGGLKITHAYYYLPNGRNIHRRFTRGDGDLEKAEKEQQLWGVDPDDGFFVPMTPDQIEKMIEVRREGDILRHKQDETAPSAVTPEWLETQLGDIQLAAALRALLGRVETGTWPQVGRAGGQLLIDETKRASLIRRRELVKEHLESIEKELAELDQPNDDGDETAKMEPDEAGEVPAEEQVDAAAEMLPDEAGEVPEMEAVGEPVPVQ